MRSAEGYGLPGQRWTLRKRLSRVERAGVPLLIRSRKKRTVRPVSAVTASSLPATTLQPTRAAKTDAAHHARAHARQVDTVDKLLLERPNIPCSASAAARCSTSPQRLHQIDIAGKHHMLNVTPIRSRTVHLTRVTHGTDRGMRACSPTPTITRPSKSGPDLSIGRPRTSSSRSKKKATACARRAVAPGDTGLPHQSEDFPRSYASVQSDEL